MSLEPDCRACDPILEFSDGHENPTPTQDKRERWLYVSVKVAFRYADCLCRFRDCQRDAWDRFDGCDVKGLC
jgi:hypothetical protein